MTNSKRAIETSQANWAVEAGTPMSPRKGYVAAVESNLFLGDLHPETRLEFDKADGAELRPKGRSPAKMASLVSSSALGVNFFDGWRDVDKAPLAKALDLEGAINRLNFEHICTNYPVGPRSPNLDLRFGLEGGGRVGVESKFTEPYGTPGVDSPLSLKYHPQGEGRWEHVGLKAAQRLADSLRGKWDYLDVPQLLKHLLGLRSERPDEPARLLYLWYDTGHHDAKRHRIEIDRFTDLVQDQDVEFRSLSYQEVFRRLMAGRAEPTPGWASYVGRRYFTGAATT